MWRSEDIYFALGQGIDALTNERVAERVHPGRTGSGHRAPGSCSASSRR